ncbi:MAG TPA: hypothetical protein VFB50_18105 [Chloroflexota bacterium]|nr:hypothetical protein [Chloroflexota bacterium]
MVQFSFRSLGFATPRDVLTPHVLDEGAQRGVDRVVAQSTRVEQTQAHGDLLHVAPPVGVAHDLQQARAVLFGQLTLELTPPVAGLIPVNRFVAGERAVLHVAGDLGRAPPVEREVTRREKWAVDAGTLQSKAHQRPAPSCHNPVSTSSK